MKKDTFSTEAEHISCSAAIIECWMLFFMSVCVELLLFISECATRRKCDKRQGSALIAMTGMELAEPSLCLVYLTGRVFNFLWKKYPLKLLLQHLIPLVDDLNFLLLYIPSLLDMREIFLFVLEVAIKALIHVNLLFFMRP